MPGFSSLDGLAITNLDDSFSDLTEQIEQGMKHYEIPGVAVGVYHRGRESMASFGVTSVDDPLEATPDTLFRIGSITKTYTGTAVMALVERGLLDLDKPIRMYLPDLRLKDQQVAERVTMRHLLTHTAGWTGDYFEDTGNNDNALSGITGVLAKAAQETPLGTAYSYNNNAFSLAGHILEVITGETYETLIRVLLLEPLGLNRTFFSADDAIQYRIAMGHDNLAANDYKPSVFRPWAVPRIEHPAGGLVSNIPDQLRYARFHLGDRSLFGDAVLQSADSVRQMQIAQASGGAGGRWGIAWGVTRVNGLGVISHAGTGRFMCALLTLVPSKDFACVLMTNSIQGRTWQNNLMKWTLAHFLGLREDATRSDTLLAHELLPYQGLYTAAVRRVELVARNDVLVMYETPNEVMPILRGRSASAHGPIHLLVARDERVFSLEDGLPYYQGEFVRGVAGEIEWLRFDGQLHRKEF